MHRNKTHALTDESPSRRFHRRAAGIRRKLFSKGDEFFAALDRQRVGLSNRMIAVYGVHVWRKQVWIQLGPMNDPTSSTLVHLAESCSPSRVLAALDTWFSEPPEGRARIIDVMHGAA